MRGGGGGGVPGGVFAVIGVSDFGNGSRGLFIIGACALEFVEDTII